MISKTLKKKINKFDDFLTHFLQNHGTDALRYSLAIVFIWFGILKPFGLSSAIPLVKTTVYWFNPSWFIPFLGWWEVLIGVCFLIKPLWRVAIFLMAAQMVGTFVPLFLLHDISWLSFGVPSLEGQYIIKNIVLIAAAIVVGGHVRDK